MTISPETDPFQLLDVDSFRALRKDPARLEARLDHLLTAVSERMLKPFQESPPAYQTFKKAPAMSLDALVAMPNSGKPIAKSAMAEAKKTEKKQTQAPPVSPVGQRPASPPPTPKGSLLDTMGGEAARGVVNADLPDTVGAATVADQVPETLATPPLRTSEAPVSKNAAPTDILTAKQADAEAMKKRFDDRQERLDDLFKNKGKIT